jgi:hypothetical protein
MSDCKGSALRVGQVVTGILYICSAGIFLRWYDVREEKRWE